MTVRRLIEVLGTCDPEAIVLFQPCEAREVYRELAMIYQGDMIRIVDPGAMAPDRFVHPTDAVAGAPIAKTVRFD